MGQDLQSWDTHDKGYTVHNAFGKQKPDMCFISKHKEPAYVATLCEAKPDLGSKPDLDEVAVQLKERKQALQPYQRTKWTFISMDETRVKLWVFTNVSTKGFLLAYLDCKLLQHEARAWKPKSASAPLICHQASDLSLNILKFVFTISMRMLPCKSNSALSATRSSTPKTAVSFAPSLRLSACYDL